MPFPASYRMTRKKQRAEGIHNYPTSSATGLSPIQCVYGYQPPVFPRTKGILLLSPGFHLLVLENPGLCQSRPRQSHPAPFHQPLPGSCLPGVPACLALPKDLSLPETSKKLACHHPPGRQTHSVKAGAAYLREDSPCVPCVQEQACSREPPESSSALTTTTMHHQWVLCLSGPLPAPLLLQRKGVPIPGRLGGL